MDGAPLDFKVLPILADPRNEEGQKYRVITQGQPGKLSVPPCDGFADSAIISAVYFKFFKFQFRLVRFDIAKHGILSNW
jgi:hypothetical protein